MVVAERRSLLVLVVATFAGISDGFSIFHGHHRRAHGIVPHPSFADYVRKYEKRYQHDQEYKEREAIYESSLSRINQFNKENELRGRKWRASVNHLADRTEKELKLLRGYKRHKQPGTLLQFASTAPRAEKALHRVADHPAALDWTNLTAIRDSRDQGECGSCWAFSAETTMRARAEVAMGRTPHFSVAQLVECVPNPRACGGEGGCDGATVELAYDYVLKHGLRNEQMIKYSTSAKSMSDSNCPAQMRETEPEPTHAHLDAEGSEVHSLRSMHGNTGLDIGMRAWTKLAENRLSPVYQALLEGPVAVAVVAGDAWWYYASGILTDEDCSTHVVNHAVTLTGYGTSSHGDGYWLLKNSWGSGWGEDGNIRVERLPDKKEEALCGVDKSPEVGVACKPFPEQVTVCGTCGILYDAVVPHFKHV